MSTAQSETPLTDAHVASFPGGIQMFHTFFMRKLELESASRRERIEELQRELATRVQWAEYERMKAERDKALRDAGRYRWLRGQHWDTSALAVVSDPKENVRLGTYCPSEELLDAAVDAAIDAARGEKG